MRPGSPVPTIGPGTAAAGVNVYVRSATRNEENVPDVIVASALGAVNTKKSSSCAGGPMNGWVLRFEVM
jgi:hypothetical protein